MYFDSVSPTSPRRRIHHKIDIVLFTLMPRRSSLRSAAFAYTTKLTVGHICRLAHSLQINLFYSFHELLVRKNMACKSNKAVSTYTNASCAIYLKIVYKNGQAKNLSYTTRIPTSQEKYHLPTHRDTRLPRLPQVLQPSLSVALLST